jgi:signal recognition particle GTPase
MTTLDRRDYLKSMIGGAVVLTMRTTMPLLTAQEKQAASASSRATFWKRVDDAKARDLVESAVKAAHAQVETQRAVNAAQRAAILLGAGADAPYHKQAASHYETRNAELRKNKEALARFVKSAGDSGERNFARFVEKGSMKEFAKNARKSVIDKLLHSDISPDEARNAVKTLDERLSQVQEMKSFADLTSYLDHHLDELLASKMPDQDPNGLCVFVLLITSLLVVLILVAILICVLTLGFDCSGVLNQLIDQACPDP